MVAAGIGVDEAEIQVGRGGWAEGRPKRRQARATDGSWREAPLGIGIIGILDRQVPVEDPFRMGLALEFGHHVHHGRARLKGHLDP